MHICVCVCVCVCARVCVCVCVCSHLVCMCVFRGMCESFIDQVFKLELAAYLILNTVVLFIYITIFMYSNLNQYGNPNITHLHINTIKLPNG